MMKTECFCLEKVSLLGFCNFCKKNAPLLISVTFALFFAYGIKLVCYSIGSDTELFAADKPSILKWNIQIGRFGLALLQRLWYIREFNPLTTFFVAFCLIWLFTISWCYIIAVFGNNTGRNNKLIPFAMLFMTMPVWAEQFYFVFQAAETAAMILICPYVIYLLYRGFLENKKDNVICGLVLLVLMTSVYQAIIPLFCAGVFACFILLRENSDYEPLVYRRLCLKLFLTLIAALAVYFILDKIFVNIIFQTEKSEYLYNKGKWGERSLKDGITRILLYGYMLTIGHMPAVQAIAEPVMARFAREGMDTARIISNLSRAIGNVLLLPAAICFIVQTARTSQKKILSGGRLLYMLAGIGVPLSIMLLTIISGDFPPVRAMYALPFALAFMMFYLITKHQKRIAYIISGIALLVSAYQAQFTAQLFYSHYLCYQADVRLAVEVDRRVIKMDNAQKLPLAFIGKYEPDFKTNFLQGGVLGHSCFGWFDPTAPEESTQRGLAFMQSLGINYEQPDENQMNQAREAALNMPDYPAPGSVKYLEDVIVVKLSDSTYKPED